MKATLLIEMLRDWLYESNNVLEKREDVLHTCKVITRKGNHKTKQNSVNHQDVIHTDYLKGDATKQATK